ncbi:response regulator [Desulfobacterales bacterium HSG16]|nr:response regulator [Desulfobacterales bacterium HSG16]
MKYFKNRYDILIIVLLFFLSVPAQYYEILSFAENKTLSIRHYLRLSFKNLRTHDSVEKKAVIANINESFYEKYGTSPLRRSDLAKIITVIKSLGARVIVLAMPINFSDTFGEDAVLAEAIKDAGNVVLESHAIFDSQNRFTRIAYPISDLLKNAESGYLHVSENKNLDNFIDKLQIFPDLIQKKDGWPLAVSALSEYAEKAPRLNRHMLFIKNFKISLDRNYDFRIDFTNGIKSIEAYEFIDTDRFDGQQLEKLKKQVQGKFVIINDTSLAAHNRFDTPAGVVSEPEIIAETINSFFEKNPLISASLTEESLFGVILIFLVCLALNFFVTPISRFFCFFLIFSAYLFSATAFYVFQGIVFSMSYSIVVAISAFFITILYNYTHKKNKKINLAEKLNKKHERLEKVEAASQAKTEFLARMNHEIRTPINTIFGMTDMTLRTKLDRQQKENLLAVMDSAGNLLEIIDDILDFSKIEDGNVELEIIDFDLDKILRSVLERFHKDAEKKGVSLNVRRNESAPRYLEGDAARIMYILLQLIENAIKFTNKGEIILNVSGPEHIYDLSLPDWVQKSMNPNFMLFSIRDTGQGIPKEKHEKIFESFSHPDDSTARSDKGSGLGLSISRYLIELMEGNIWVESEPGYGSTFFFRIVLKPGNPAIVLAQEAECLADTPLYFYSNARILLVEDNPMNIRVAKTYLSKIGIRVVEAKDGKQALDMLGNDTPGNDALDNDTFDLVLMDIEMSNMDGLEATERIRKGEAGKKYANIPIIALTAHATREYRKKSLDAGMNDYITKPIDFNRLCKVLMPFIKSCNPEDVKNKSTELPSVIETGNKDLPANLPGINVEIGMKRLGGNRKLFYKLLKEFAQQYYDSAEQIRRAVEKHDIKKAVLITHNLKGVTSIISASDVFKAVSDLNKSLHRKKDSYINQSLHKYETCLSVLIKSIRSLDKKDEPVSVKADNFRTDLNREEWLSISSMLSELNDYIEQHNPKAETCLASFKTRLGHHEDILQMEKQISQYDYRGAEKTLTHFKDIMNAHCCPQNEL